jgi:1-acyl-sn-glycerol-3-phosphate acyltransferase
LFFGFYDIYIFISNSKTVYCFLIKVKKYFLGGYNLAMFSYKNPEKLFSKKTEFINQSIMNLFVHPYYKLFTKVRVNNAERIPAFPSNYLMVSNHLSFNDPPLLFHVFDNKIAGFAKEELFQSFLSRSYFTTINTIPVDRDKPGSSSIKLAKQALKKEGWKIMIFIEGTRNKDPDILLEPQQGAMFIAKVAKVPVLPIGIVYPEKHHRKVIVNIGELYYPSQDLSLEDQSWECLEKISRLSGQKLPYRGMK